MIAALVLAGHRRILIILRSGGMDRPVGIHLVRPGERAKVGAPGRDDGVHMIDLEDIAYRDRWNVNLVADLVGEGRLEHPAIDRLFGLGDLARGYVHKVDARLLES